MSDFDYDLFVIGAGSGGVRGARMSAGYGAKVAVAEEYRVGGTCVIRGCVPKKLFVYASHFADDFEDAAGFGWRVGETRFDWPALVANKDREIDRLNGIYIANLERSGVELFMDRAVLEDAHTVRLVNQERTFRTRSILIAAGAAPFVPDLPGREHAITSNEAFHLERLPERIAIVGGGYIAVEFAGIFAGLGVDVTLIYRGPQILRGFDDDMRNGLAREMRKRGIDLRLNTQIVEIAKDGEIYQAILDSGEKLSTGLVMYATGRNPNTNGIGLERAGVKLGSNGEVAVDEYSRSSVESIFAVGDVTDRVALTPVAISEGMAVAETLFNDNPTPVDHAMIPSAIFSQPEIGTVGLTETEAREHHGAVDIYKSRFRPMKHTLSGRDEQTIMKLVVDAETDRVLGCHILGPDGAEIVQSLAIAMRMGATKADFDATMALHPTAAEELVTMREKWVPSEPEIADKQPRAVETAVLPGSSE